MAHLITGGADLKYDSLAAVPLGGQSELGQLLWIFIYAGEMLLVDAGAVYPTEDLPGVDLLLPNTNFLEANQERILALLLTNGHEEHSGAVGYLLNHLRIPRIMAPRFVSAMLSQSITDRISSHPQLGLNKVSQPSEIDTIETRHPYQIGPFEVEWIQVNDAIADACALKIATPEGTVVYTSSFKLDQTPVDKRLLDVSRLAQIGDAGVLLLISDSAGVEDPGYTPSEKSVIGNLEKHVNSSTGRVFVVVAGTNSHRLQLLFDIAKNVHRKVILVGEPLIKTAVAAAITGNLSYDRKTEASLENLSDLKDSEILVVATGLEGDPMNILEVLAYGYDKSLTVKKGDTVIYSAEIFPGRSRQMAMILDQFLSLGVKVIYGSRQGVHVSKHASQEELKFMLSIVRPRYFIPAMGEGRHIMHHAQLAAEWGLPNEAIFPLKNGEILEIDHGNATVIGTIESQAVLFNRDQGERVTTYSVNERRVLSLEGVITIGLVVNEEGKLIAGPSIEVGASGFRYSPEWNEAKIELSKTIVESVQSSMAPEVSALRNTVRDIALRILRTRLSAKPAVQVILHELATSHPQSA